MTRSPSGRGLLYQSGARLVELHPTAPPIGSLASGIALHSYGGRRSRGFNADRDLVPDLRDFANAVERAFRRLAHPAAEEA